MLDSLSPTLVGQSTHTLLILSREWHKLFSNLPFMTNINDHISRETTPDVHTLDLSGSDPSLLPQFVSEAHNNVREFAIFVI